jgi:sugar lactone lactonase YvrE
MPARTVRRFGPAGRFFEAPRWRDGRWWVSDMTAQTVLSLTPNGDAREELRLEDRPSGLGWMPDGSLIVVSMERRVLLRLKHGDRAPSIHADLGPLCGATAGYINDMVVGSDGHAYVGFDPNAEDYGFASDLGAVIHVDPNGRAAIAATGLAFPNGMVMSLDEASLIVAETGTPRLTRFARDVAGALGARTSWAFLESKGNGGEPASDPIAQGAVLFDGCALDAAGHVWVANANSPSCLRLAEGGQIVDRVSIPDNYRCLACALGGADGATLLLCGLDLGPGGDMSAAQSHLFITEVGTPGAGTSLFRGAP